MKARPLSAIAVVVVAVLLGVAGNGSYDFLKTNMAGLAEFVRSSWFPLIAFVVLAAAWLLYWVVYPPEKRAHPSTVPASPPRTTTPVREPERIFPTITPAQLMEFFVGRTAIQAQTLAGPYLPKWMRLTGPLGNVQGSDPLQVTFQVEWNREHFPNWRVGKQVYMFYQRAKWADRLMLLQPGERNSVVGQITSITPLGVHLRNCELIENSR